MSENSVPRQKEYSSTSFDTGLYHIELAHKNPVPPKKAEFGGATFQSREGEIYVSVANERIEVGIEGKEKAFLPAVRLTKDLLAEKTLKDIIKNHSSSIATEDAKEISATIDNNLRTASKISDRLKFSPSNTLRYLKETLGVSPIEFIGAEDIAHYRNQENETPEEAIILALGEILGFYKVREVSSISGEPQISQKTSNIPLDEERINTLASMICDNPAGAEKLTKLFNQMIFLKEKTYLAKSLEELIPIIQKKNSSSKSPDALEIEDLAVPLPLIGCLIYDKFGADAAQDFFQRYFLKEHQKERAMTGEMGEKTQTATHIELNGVVKTETQKKLKEALDFVVGYYKCQQDLGEITKLNIIEKNKNHPALFSQFQQTMIIDSTGILPQLAMIEVVTEKKDGGKTRRKYKLEGREISFEEQGMFYTGKRAVVDALEELRKKGDKRRIGPIEAGKDSQGRKINFNDIFLFAVCGSSLKREFSAEEANVLYGLEQLVNSEYEFEYEEIQKVPYDICREKKKLGTVMVPSSISPMDVRKMSLLDAIMHCDSGISSCASDIVKILRQYEDFTDDDLMSNRVSIRNLEFRANPKKAYKVKRRIRGASEFETIGQISISETGINLLRKMDFRHIIDRKYLKEQERAEAIALNRIKYSGIDYIENGEIYIVRQQSLDELLEEFCQMSGSAGKDLDIKMIRITNKANQKYFGSLLEKMTAKGFLSFDEMKELERIRKSLGISITNDTQRILMLETAYLRNKGIIEHISLPIALMTDDEELTMAEKFLLELYLGVMDAKKVPEDIKRFYHARIDELVKKRQALKKPEEELLELIKTTIIKGNGPIEQNPDYTKIRTILVDINHPSKQRAEEFEEIKKSYSEKFMGDLVKTIDELPGKGEKVFTDMFFDVFNTSKKDLVLRIKTLVDDEKKIEDGGIGFFIIDTAKRGDDVREGELRKYLYAMSSLHPEVRDKMAENMMTWAETPAHVEITDLIASKILSPENIARVRTEIETRDKDVDDAFEKIFEDAPKEKEHPATSELYKFVDTEIKRIQKKYRIEKNLGVTDEDMKDVFGDKTF